MALLRLRRFLAAQQGAALHHHRSSPGVISQPGSCTLHHQHSFRLPPALISNIYHVKKQALTRGDQPAVPVVARAGAGVRARGVAAHQQLQGQGRRFTPTQVACQAPQCIALALQCTMRVQALAGEALGRAVVDCPCWRSPSLPPCFACWTNCIEVPAVDSESPCLRMCRPAHLGGPVLEGHQSILPGHLAHGADLKKAGWVQPRSGTTGPAAGSGPLQARGRIARAHNHCC